MPAKWKTDEVEKIKKLADEFPIVGVIDFSNMPLAQLQSMRESLRKDVVIIGGRKRIFLKALEVVKTKHKGVENLEKYMRGQPALLFTKMNPFTLVKQLDKSKTSAPAKPGSIAPKDIVVPAGPTGFAPGPIIGELSSVGIKAGIDAGKVVIKQDSLVCKTGEIINAKLAGILVRLGIEPMEIGLNIVAVYEKGEIFEKSVLSINEAEYISNIMRAHIWALNLAVEAGMLNSETTEVLIVRAFNDSKALARSQNILAKEVVDEILAQADAEMNSVKSAADI